MQLRNIYEDVKGQSEDELQQKCVFWFHNAYPSLRGCLFHVPNGGLRNAREGARFKKMGVVPGVSDLILLVRARTFLFELKDDNGRQTSKQKDWQVLMEGNDFNYDLIRSLSAFRSKVGEILYSLDIVR